MIWYDGLHLDDIMVWPAGWCWRVVPLIAATPLWK